MKFTDGRRGDTEPQVLDLDLGQDIAVFHSRKYGFSVRHVWRPDGDEGQIAPTKKGIQMKREDVLTFVEELADAINELGILPFDVVIETEDRDG